MAAVEFYAISLYRPTILTQPFCCEADATWLPYSRVRRGERRRCDRRLRLYPVVQQTGIRTIAMIGFVGTATALSLIAWPSRHQHSRGGLTTKIHAAEDTHGRRLALVDHHRGPTQRRRDARRSPR